MNAQTHSKSGEKQVTFPAVDGAEVIGILRYPEKTILGAFLLLHGISTNKNEYLHFFETIADRLAEEGFGSLRIDFRGHGESLIPYREFTVGSQILDSLAAVQCLRKEFAVEKIHVFGCSFGAPPCIYLKATFDEKIQGIVLLSPVLDYDRTFLCPESVWGKETFPKDKLLACIERGEGIPITESFKMEPRLLADLLHSDVGEWIGRIDQPIWIIHGTEDDMVPISITRDYVREFPQLNLLEIAGMEHGFTEKGDKTGRSKGTSENVNKIVERLITAAR